MKFKNKKIIYKTRLKKLKVKQINIKKRLKIKFGKFKKFYIFIK